MKELDEETTMNIKDSLGGTHKWKLTFLRVKIFLKFGQSGEER